jgi:hypothetical protein
MPSAPRQSVEPRGHVRFDRFTVRHTTLSCRAKKEAAQNQLRYLQAKDVCFLDRSLFVHESDRAGIEAVISANYIELTGINFGFENGHG